MKRQPPIRVTVLDDPGRPPCEARCGLDLSSAEVRSAIAQALQQRFGSRVELRYAALSEGGADGALPPAGGDEPDGVRERLSRGELVLPLLLINGRPRISGYFDLRSLLEAVQAVIEMAAP